MKKAFIITGFIVMMMFFSIFAVAQTNTKITSAGAKIIPSIALVENLPMHFGTMTVKAGQGGTCTVSTSGVRSKTGGVTLQSLAPFMSLATYTVSGEPGKTYAITLPLTISVIIPGNSMTIGTLLAKSTSGTQSHTATGTLGVGGTEQFTIGGTLTVAAGQTVGLYEGTFQVTVVYN